MANDGKVRLTSFVDFVVKNGTPRLTVVRDHLRAQTEEYSVMRDFYKRLREELISLHSKNGDLSALDALLAHVHDNKRAVFQQAIVGYRRFFRAFSREGAVTWLGRPKPADWSYGGLVVKVNPEIGFIRNGKQHIIKLYLKEDALGKMRVASISNLMSQVIENTNAEFGVLDVRRGRLYSSARTTDLDVLLRAEAQSFAGMIEGLKNAA